MSGPSSTVEGTRPAAHDDVSVLAQSDKKAARILARSIADREKAEAQAQRREADAAAAREREAAQARKVAAKADAAQVRRATRRRRRATARHEVGQLVQVARREAAAVYSLGVYAAVVYVAATSQAQVAHDRFGWSWSRAAGAAIFIEGASLAFALTAHRLRLDGQRARIAHAMTWAAALFGAGMNYLAHAFDPNLSPLYAQLQAIALAVSSLLGIILWETRSGARSGAGQRSLGLDYWIRFTRAAFWAWSATIADHRIRTREDAITAGDQLHAAYLARRERAAAQKRAEQAEKAFVAAAREAAKVAAKNGDPGPALSYLGLLAEHGPNVLAARPRLGSVPARRHGQDAADDGHGADRAAALGCGCADSLRQVTEALQSMTAQVQSWADVGQGPTDEGRGGQATVWQQRLDELDNAFRAADGRPLPIPIRRVIIKHMAGREGNRFAWSNHETIGAAVRDVRARRDANT